MSRLGAWMLPSAHQSTRSLLLAGAVMMTVGLLLPAAGAVPGPDWLHSVGAGVLGVAISYVLRVLWRLGERL